MHLSVVIVIDSVFKSYRSYYPQTFLEQCKYKMIEKEKNIIQSSDESSDDENSEEENFEGNSE